MQVNHDAGLPFLLLVCTLVQEKQMLHASTLDQRSSNEKEKKKKEIVHQS